MAWAHQASRRDILASAVAVGSTAVSGCLFGIGGSTDPEPGTIIAENVDTSRHTVTVIVTRTSGGEGGGNVDTRTSRTFSYEVDSGEQRTVTTIAEPGTYRIEGSIETGANASTNAEFYEGLGGGVGPGVYTFQVRAPDLMVVLYSGDD